VEKCNAQRQGKGDTIPWCDVYEEQVKQTSIDVFVFAQIGSKLRAKLTAGDVELLKRHIMNTAVVSYYYGKEKGGAGEERPKRRPQKQTAGLFDLQRFSLVRER